MTPTGQHTRRGLTTDRLWNIRDVAQFLAVSERTVRRWVAQGVFPEPIRINGSTRWLPTTVTAFLADRLAESRRS